ncbi:hypothetical protein K1719_002161 [Acacia pycnantha]|nr:hypothetical protein K1719_002161 [Acacia pycnantha]
MTIGASVKESELEFSVIVAEALGVKKDAWAYMPEFFDNQFDLDLGENSAGRRLGIPMAKPKDSVLREFIRKHIEALESDHVSENLHHQINLIFGYDQRGKAAEESVNVLREHV